VAKVVDRRLLVLPAVALVVAAVLGFVAGRGHARGAPPREQMHTIAVGTVLLDLPARWRAAASVRAIPGLELRHAVSLAPGGDPSSAGLLAGQLPAGGAAPLPSSFLTRLRKPPTTAVVSLQETQAYRYAALALPGAAQSMTAYVVPNPGSVSTALVCYAASSQDPEMQACERAVATLTLAGQAQSYDLTPQSEYAQNLSALVATLDAKRVALRGRLVGHVPPGEAQRLATGLARAFARAGASLSGVEPTVATGQAQAALSAAILKARDAYAALAAAAAQRSEAGFAAARSGVEASEAGVDAALEGFALLGYQSV
jgi:hypothetical protein